MYKVRVGKLSVFSPIGNGRDELIASSKRTRALLAALAPALAS